MARFLSFAISVLALVIVILFAHPDAAPANGMLQPIQFAPSPICTRNSDCASPLVCRSGRCMAECRADRDCQAGAHCRIVPQTLDPHATFGACVMDQPRTALAPDAPYCVQSRDCTSGSCDRATNQCH